jgi:hypothetical protein
MPVKKGATHCTVCGEAITSSLTGSLRPEGKHTTSLELPMDKQPVVVEEPAVPPTTNFAKSNGDLSVHLCLRCNSVLNPAAKFCSVCGRASEPTAFERTIDATRSARGRAVAVLRQAFESITDKSQLSSPAGIIALVLLGLSLLCFLISFFIYPFFMPERPEVATVVQQVRSLWWLGFAILMVALAAFFKR